MGFQCYACGLCFLTGAREYDGPWQRKETEDPPRPFAGCFYAVCQSCGTLHGIEHEKVKGAEVPSYRLCARSGPVFRSLTDNQRRAYQKRAKRAEQELCKQEKAWKQNYPYSINLLPRRPRRWSFGFGWSDLWLFAVCIFLSPVLLVVFGFNFLRDSVLKRSQSHDRRPTAEEIKQWNVERNLERKRSFANYDANWPILVDSLKFPEAVQSHRNYQQQIANSIGRSFIYPYMWGRERDEEIIASTLPCSHCDAEAGSLSASYTSSSPCPSCHQCMIEEDYKGTLHTDNYVCGKVFRIPLL